MAHTLIVEKEEARVMFIRDAAVPLMLDALWPPVGYNYVLWNGSIEAAVIANPWNYVLHNNKFVLAPYAFASNAEENKKRAELLVQLVRATNRHRRMVMKEDVLGQDVVYRMKTDEAMRFLADPQQNTDFFPWLMESATLENLSVVQAANQIMFRYTQSVSVLRHTENQRRWFVRRILTSGVNELETVKTELTEYERRG